MRTSVRSDIITLDLHGLRVKDAIERLDFEIDRAILKKVWRIDVIHGLGTGKVKNAVHEYLAKCKVVDRFELDSQNPGLTKAYL